MTATRKVVRRRKPSIPLGVPVNVKVAGQRTLLKGIVLDTHPSDPFAVVVRTGRRGRPAHLALAEIERVRAL